VGETWRSMQTVRWWQLCVRRCAGGGLRGVAAARTASALEIILGGYFSLRRPLLLDCWTAWVCQEREALWC
jgi:hypothetical protein